jgi:hypothetical protein
MKEPAARKAYQVINQGLLKMLAQYSERFIETYQENKATEDPSNPISIKEPDQPMFFFARIGSSQVRRV